METVQNISKSIKEKEQQFDEQTKLQIQSLLEEIDRKQQSSYQKTETEGKPRYIKFGSDKERKVLLFTGKVDKKDIQAKDYETGLDIPGRYTIRFLFECYDITTSRIRKKLTDRRRYGSAAQKMQEQSYIISRKISESWKLFVMDSPYSTATTYLINPKLD